MHKHSASPQVYKSDINLDPSQFVYITCNPPMNALVTALHGSDAVYFYPYPLKYAGNHM